MLWFIFLGYGSCPCSVEEETTFNTSYTLIKFQQNKKLCFLYDNHQLYYSSPRITHRDIDISALPRVSDTIVRAALSGSKSESTDSVDKKCDRCTGDDKMKAVICCTDCKKSYCHQHAEVIMCIECMLRYTI